MGTIQLLYGSYAVAGDALITGGSDSGGFPKSNLLSNRMDAIWRSADLTAANTILKIELFEAKTLRTVVLGPTNLTKHYRRRVRAWSDNTYTGVPTYDSGWVEPFAGTDPYLTNERGIWVIHDLGQEVTSSYWTIEILDYGNPDGYIQATLLLMPNHLIPSLNYSPEGASFSFDNNSISSTTFSGDTQVWRKVNPRVFRFQWPFIEEDEAWNAFYEFMDTVGFDDNVFVVPDPDDSEDIIQKRSFLGRISEMDALTHVLEGVSGSHFGAGYQIKERISIVPRQVATPVGRLSSAGRLIGNEPKGIAIDFLNMNMVCRNPADPASEFAGDPNSWLTYSSPSTKYVRSAAGVWEAGTTLRCHHEEITLAKLGVRIETTRTNSIRNNSAQGAVGGSPGTLPTNWATTNGGLALQIVETGTESGIEYVDIRFSGTMGGGGNCNIRMETLSAIVAATAQTWTTSAFIKLSGGSLANIGSILMDQQEYTSGGAYVRNNFSSVLVIDGTLRRFISTATLSGGGTTARLVPFIQIYAAAGAALNFTLRIGWPQSEQGGSASSPIRTTGSAVTRLADVLYKLLPFAMGPEFTMIKRYRSPQDTTGTSHVVGGLANIAAPSFNDTVYLSLVSTQTNRGILTIRTGGGNGGSSGITGANQAGRIRAAGRLKTGDVQLAGDGALFANVPGGVIPTTAMDRLVLGSAPWSVGNSALDSYLESVELYPRAFSDAELLAKAA